MTASANEGLTQHQLITISRSYFRDILTEQNNVLFQNAVTDKCGTLDREGTLAESEGRENWLVSMSEGSTVRAVMGVSARRVLLEAGFTSIDEAADEFQLLCENLIRAKIQAERVFQAKLMKDYAGTTPTDPLFTGIFEDGLPCLSEQSTDKAVSLGCLLERFKAVKRKTTVRKTAAEYDRVCQMLIEWFGENRAVTTLKAPDIAGFRDALEKLPLAKKTKGKVGYDNFRQTVGNPLKLPTISPKTADKYLQFAKAFFTWCADEEIIDKVPGSKVKVHYTASKKARYPFEEETLCKIFASPMFRGHKEKKRQHSGDIIKQDDYFWMTLLAVFSGMRCGEIVQLKHDDLQHFQGVPYFVVNEKDDKKVKTKFSIRRIPVHPTLIRLGLLNFFETRKKNSSQDRVFFRIPMTVEGDPANAFSKKMNRYLKDIGAKPPKTSFHSFRHTFSDACDDAEIIQAQRYAMMGQSDRSAGAQYGTGAAVPKLLKSISRITYSFEGPLIEWLEGEGQKLIVKDS